jgi:hypothetical protein
MGVRQVILDGFETIIEITKAEIVDRERPRKKRGVGEAISDNGMRGEAW